MDLKAEYEKLAFPSVARFKAWLKKQGHEYSTKELVAFVKDHSITQLFKTRKVKKDAFFPIYGAPNSYQCDTTFFPDIFKGSNNGSKGFLNLININTRFMHCLKIKGAQATPQEVIKLCGTVKGMEFLSTDRGGEFKNAQVKDYLEGRQIEHKMWNVGKDDSYDHNHLGKVERSNGTIKGIIYKLLEAAKTKKWVDKLQKSVDIYNGLEHSSIKMAPEDVTPEDELFIILKAQQKTRKILKNDNFEIGDQVRIPISKDQFSKWGIKHSKEIFTIVDEIGKDHKKNSITYRVKDSDGDIHPKRFKYYDLVLFKNKKDAKAAVPQTTKSTLEKASSDNRILKFKQRHLNPLKNTPQFQNVPLQRQSRSKVVQKAYEPVLSDKQFLKASKKKYRNMIGKKDNVSKILSILGMNREEAETDLGF